MEAAQAVESYLLHRRANYAEPARPAGSASFAKHVKARALSVLLPKPTVNPVCSPLSLCEGVGDLLKGRHVPSNRHIGAMFERNLEAALDRVTSCVFSHLITRMHGRRSAKRVTRLCAFVLALLGAIHRHGLRVRRRPGRLSRLSRSGHGYRVAPRGVPSCSGASTELILRTVRSCTYLKSALAGFRLSHTHMLMLVRLVGLCVKRKVGDPFADWVDFDITKSGLYSRDSLLENGANFIANAVCHQHLTLPAHLVLDTTLCRWRSFRPRYIAKILHILVFFDHLAVDGEAADVLERFRASLNSSLNDRLFTLREGGSSFMANSVCHQHLTRRLLHFYTAVNGKMLFSPMRTRFNLHWCNLERLVATGAPCGAPPGGGRSSRASEVSRVMWITLVVILLLRNNTCAQRSKWMAVQLLAQFFHGGGVRCGVLRCRRVKSCFRCLIQYTDLSGGLYTILQLLRKSEVYPHHVNLLKILVKHNISKMYATFGSMEKRGAEDYAQKSVCHDPQARSVYWGAHYTPLALRYAAHLVSQRCLALAARDDMNIKLKQRRVDVALPFPVYQRLVFAVHNGVPGVKVLHNAEKVLKTRARYAILEHLAAECWRGERARSAPRGTTGGRLPFPGLAAVVAHVYLAHKGVDDCLSDLVVQHTLNVMQRTQACHVLASHPQTAALVVPQLVQSLSVDPGNRLWSLLSLSLRDARVRERLPYFMACLVHTTEWKPGVRKAESFLALMLQRPGVPPEPLTPELTSVELHSHLLRLTASLAAVEPDKRAEALQRGLHGIIQRMPGAAPVQVFDDSLERGHGAILSPVCAETTATKVVSLNAESAKVLKSATRAPFLLDFNLYPSGSVRYIYKMNDDMRQDALVVQLKLFMLHVFREHKLEAYLQPFLVVPYSSTLSTLLRSRSAIFELVAAGDGDSGTGRSSAVSLVTPAAVRVACAMTYDLDCGDSCPDTEERSVAESAGAPSVRDTPKSSATSPPDSPAVSERMLTFCLNWTDRNDGCLVSKNASTHRRRDSQREHMLGGIVGFISGAVSRHAIGKEYNASLAEYFELRFGPRGSKGFARAMDNFVASLAGYSLLSFLLQIKDRHNGNLLISPEGHIVHIDFGFILGASPAADVTFESAPFKLTREMTDLLGGVGSDNFQRYVRLLVAGYLAVREEAETFISLVKLLEHCGMASFRRSSLFKLRQRFMLDTTPERAAAYMIRRIQVALHSKTTKVYDIVQAWQQGIQH